MAVISSGDLSFSLIPEATVGTTPTTGASRYELPIRTGQALPTYNSNAIESTTMRPNRASNGSRPGNGSGEGSFELAFQRCDAMDLLMQSALSGTWTNDVLKGNKVDTSFTTQVKAASNMFWTFPGCVANSFTLEATAAEGVTASFDFVLLNRITGATDNPLAVTPTGQTVEWNGAEVTNISVGGTSVNYTSLSLEITNDRNPRNVLGSYVPISVGTSGLRQVNFTLTAYRESFDLDNAITGAPQEVSFQVGDNETGYTFTIPAAIGLVPTDDTQDDLMVTIQFSAMYDETNLTDVMIERHQAAGD